MTDARIGTILTSKGKIIKPKKAAKKTGYDAKPWLRLVPKPEPAEFSKVRIYPQDAPVVTLGGQVTATQLRMSLDEAATLTVTIAGPAGDLSLIGLDAIGNNHLLQGVDARWRDVMWRVVRVEQLGSSWSLICEDRVASYLRAHKRPMTASRSSVTRAQFVRRLALAVKAGGGIPCYIPELKVKQGVYKQRKPGKARPGSKGPSGGSTSGWGSRADEVKVRGTTASRVQRDCLKAVLSTAVSLGASRRVMIGCVMAVTEASHAGLPKYMRSTVPADHDRLLHRGAFGQTPAWGTDREILDTEKATRAFLLGRNGKRGWKQTHGSLHAAGEPLGEMADEILELERTTTPQWQAEATKTVDLWLSRNDAVEDDDEEKDPRADRHYRGQYKFRTSGENGPINWWDVTGALAKEVRWHRWAVNNTLGFATEREMIRQNAVWEINREQEEILELEWSWDYRKTASELRVRVALPDAFALLPGMVAMVDDERPVSGRWLVDTIDVDPLHGTIAEVGLRRARGKRLEPR
jgi:hypothetical protein